MPNPPIAQPDPQGGHSVRPTLDYAERTPLWWIGRHRRLLLLLAICLAIGIPLVLYRKPLTRRVLWFYWSRQAAAHVIPASVQLTVDDPQQAVKLLATDRDYVPVSIHVSTTQPAVAGAYYVPYAFRQLSALDPRLNLMRFNPQHVPIAFMGMLRRPDGVARLVMITSPASSGMDFVVFNDKTSVLVLPLAGVLDAMPQGTYSPPGRLIFSPGNVRSRAVEPQSVTRDPSDPSHLVFDCRILEGGILDNPRPTSERRKLHAYLQNDDSITFVFHEPLGGGWPGDPLTFNIAGDPAIASQPKYSRPPAKSQTSR